MASSSLSQESLDHDDFSLTNRRSRIKVVRMRASCPPLHNAHESVETTDKDVDVDDDSHSGCGGSVNLSPTVHHSSSTSHHHYTPGSAVTGHVTFNSAVSSMQGDRDSPTRSKMKGVGVKGGTGMWGPGHIHKPKQMQVGMKDKRKLREKRRSCGLVPVHSTEVFVSTGDSLDENDRENSQYKVSTSEVIDADNPQTPEEDRKAFGARAIRNKSPSDLEADADLEDNQDYDSTFSQSETGSSRTHSTVRLQNLVGCGKMADPSNNKPMIDGGEMAITAISIGESREEVGVGGSLEGGGVSGAAGGDDKTGETLCHQNTSVEDLLNLERERTKQLEELLLQKDQMISDLQKQINQLVKV